MSTYKNSHKYRVYLCPMDFSLTNRKLYKKWFSDSMVREQMGYVGDGLSDSDIDRWEEQLNKNNQRLFNIILRSNNCIIGMCSITMENSSIVGEIEILIGQKVNRNKGYGTEAISLLLSFCKTELHLQKTVIRVLAQNISAIKCYENVGFEKRKNPNSQHDDPVIFMERMI